MKIQIKEKSSNAKAKRFTSVSKGFQEKDPDVPDTKFSKLKPMGVVI